MKNIALVAASTAIALVVGIWVAAYLTVWTPPLSSEGDGIVVFDPEIGMVARRNAHTRQIYPAIADRAAFTFDVDTDDRRARVEALGQRSAVQYDVLTIGDSFTWAYALADRDSYASRIARALGVGVENLALAAYGTVQSLQVLERNLDLRPKLVVYGIIAHHFERNVWSCAPSDYEFCLDVSHVAWDDRGSPYIAPPASNGVRRLEVHRRGDYRNPVAWLTHGIDVIYGRVSLAWTRSREPDEVKQDEAMLYLLQRMNRVMTDRQAQLLVVFLPTNYYGPPAALPGIIDKVGGGIDYLDLTDAFARNKREGGPNPYIVGDGHPSAAGHALIAREIAEHVRKAGLFPEGRASSGPERLR